MFSYLFSYLFAKGGCAQYLVENRVRVASQFHLLAHRSRKDFDQCNLTDSLFSSISKGRRSFDQQIFFISNIFCEGHYIYKICVGELGRYLIWDLVFDTSYARHHLRSPWDSIQEIWFWLDFKIQLRSDIWTEMQS